MRRISNFKILILPSPGLCCPGVLNYSHPVCVLSMSQMNQIQLYNADKNELYLVQISGMWGTWAPLNTHCSFSYFKTMVIVRDCAAKWYTRKLLLYSTTHTLFEP